MKRANTFIIEETPALRKLANNCARLWNEVDFERRQAYMRYKKFSCILSILWEVCPLICSATASE